MREIALCLPVATEKPVYPVSLWYQTDESTPLVGGTTYSTGFGFESAFLHRPNPEEYHQQTVQELVRNYLDLEQETRANLRVPLSRLNRAMRSTGDPNDTAIDLGFALEALLTHDRDVHNDVAFTVRLRGTHLYGGTSEQRQATYNLLQALYNLRSRAVHGGIIGEYETVRVRRNNGGNERVEVNQVFEQGRRLCTDLIRNVITRGSFPDWDALILGL